MRHALRTEASSRRSHAKNRRVILATKYKVLLAGAAAAPIIAANRLVGRGPVVEVKRGGVHWRLDLHEGIDFAIYLLGMFERSTVKTYERMVRAGDTVLDIGANVGAHALHLARFVGPNGKVVCFEPTAWAIEKLRTNIALNPSLASRLVPEQIMLIDSVDKPADPALFSSWPLGASPDLHAKHRGRFQSTAGARATTLDAYVTEARLSRVDVVKMDVDGHECGVLRGAVDTLRKHRPSMVMELAPYQLEETGHSVDEMIEILRSVGYGIFEMSSGSPLPMNGRSLRELVADGRSMNVIARPA